MIVKEMYCNHCKRKTFHECQSNELWRCIQCHNTQFEILDIKEDEIDWSTPTRYVYRSGELAYITLALAPDILRLNELKNLIEGKRVRVPLFKIKDEFLPKYY